MFDIKPNQIIKIDLDNGKDLYSSKQSDNDFNLAKYILSKYGHAPSFLYLDNKFNEDVFDFLLKRSDLLKFNVNCELKTVTEDYTNFKSGTFWFKYKKVYIRLNVDREETKDIYHEVFGDYTTPEDAVNSTKVKKYTMVMVAPTNVRDYPVDDFKKFIYTTDDCRIHLFIKDQYGEFNFEPLKVVVPDINIELNYGKHFIDVDKLIQERLTKFNKGLFMFHGSPGTGKTTYIKYLADKIKRDFIFVPTTMIETFTSDPNCLQYLLKKPNSVLILEDAEKAIVKRYGDAMDSSQVSSLLNLTDGILSDILQISVILTYNCPKNEIDNALRRKGRLLADYEFTPLSVEDSRALAVHLKYPEDLINEITEPTTLADVFNIGKDVEFKNELVQVSGKKVIGFGN
jgi:hypothetical protein